MKIITPRYYKDFKCIAGACTDTCCAGWDVDVDEASYKFYKSVGGEFGKRLKRVMVPEKGGGCTFTLQDGRCPFLNEKNLCDLYTELGEDRLCDTCAEFPRFINEYGNVREIGIAPSCKTAGELIFNYRGRLIFDEEDDKKPVTSYNDIDAFLYMQLKAARSCAYDIIQNERFTPDEVCVLLLDFAVRIQRHMDRERDDLIANAVNKFRDEEELEKILERSKASERDMGFKAVAEFFKEFPGMEVINSDWLKYCRIQKKFLEDCPGSAEYIERLESFKEYYRDREFEYRQLLMYYVYRYFLGAVYDINIVLKVKNAVIGYLVLRHLDAAVWHENGGTLSKTEQVDIAHLYSRQFEHSYTNFEKYSEFFMSKRCYSLSSLRRFLKP
jgi:lysine-N-methylase